MNLILKRRTIRRFKQTRIDLSILKSIVDAGRLAPSGSNLQPLEFIVVDDESLVKEVFKCTKWAGYLPPDQGPPPPGQGPVVFIVILINRKIRPSGGGQDVGAAAENMILTALANDIGTCWIASVVRPAVKRLLKIPDHHDIDSVLAMGYANEEPVVETYVDSVKYYRDDRGILHVPKKSLESVLHINSYNKK